MKSIKDIYQKTSAYAREHDEKYLYFLSKRENVSCADAIRKCVSSSHDGWSIDIKASDFEAITERYGNRRVEFVLAATIAGEPYFDPRISKQNREWAKTVLSAYSDEFVKRALRTELLQNLHPCYTDAFTDQYREFLQTKDKDIDLDKGDIMAAKNRLMDKFEAEQNEYKEFLKQCPPEKIIEASYEIATRDDIIYALEGVAIDDMSLKEVQGLLSLERPLETCYGQWLNTDTGISEDLINSIKDTAAAFAYSYHLPEDVKIDDELMDNLASYMSDEIREDVHFELAPCENKEFLERYCNLDPEFTELLRSEFSIEMSAEELDELPEEEAKAMLLKKAAEEQEEYIEALKDSPPEKIVDAAYKTATLKDIVYALEGDDCLSPREVRALLSLERPLETCYGEWLDTDTGISEDLINSIEDTAANFADSYRLHEENEELEFSE